MLFKINLATRIYINTRLLRICTFSIIFLCTILIFYNVTTIVFKFGEIKSLSSKITAMSDKFKTASKGVSEKEFSEILAKIEFANSLIDKKMFNWLSLLDRLEMVVPEGIAISSVEPDAKNQTLKLSGVGRSFRNLRNFMENLEDSKYFTEVYLMNQGNTSLGDGTQGVTFSLTCKASIK